MRAKDETGLLLPPPHKRLPEAPLLEKAGVFALALDGRAVALPYARKITLVRKVIDHIVDGDSVPKNIFKKNPDDPNDHTLAELWKIAEDAVRAARKKAA